MFTVMFTNFTADIMDAHIDADHADAFGMHGNNGHDAVYNSPGRERVPA